MCTCPISLAETHGKAGFVMSLAHAWQQLHPALGLWRQGKCCAAAANSSSCQSCLHIKVLIPLLSTMASIVARCTGAGNQISLLPPPSFPSLPAICRSECVLHGFDPRCRSGAFKMQKSMLLSSTWRVLLMTMRAQPKTCSSACRLQGLRLACWRQSPGPCMSR